MGLSETWVTKNHQNPQYCMCSVRQVPARFFEVCIRISLISPCMKYHLHF